MRQCLGHRGGSWAAGSSAVARCASVGEAGPAGDRSPEADPSAAEAEAGVERERWSEVMGGDLPGEEKGVGGSEGGS